MKITNMYLTPNKWSRPGVKLRAKKGIVVHWVANPNTTAAANRNFFENRKHGKTGFGSAHEIIGLDGEVVICIPPNEYAYHVGSSSPWAKNTNQVYTPVAWERLNTNTKGTKPYPNNCTYGIEVCHTDWNGTMTEATLESLKIRVAHWCMEWGLDPLKDVYLHQEVVGWKDCHRWFLQKPTNPNLYWEVNERWNEFKKDVQKYMNMEEVDDEMKPLNIGEYEWQMLNRVWTERYNRKEITSWKWVEKIRNRTLTAGELAFLNSIMHARLDGRDTTALEEGMKN